MRFLKKKKCPYNREIGLQKKLVRVKQKKISFKYVILEVKRKIMKLVGGNIFEITPSAAVHNSLNIQPIFFFV